MERPMRLRSRSMEMTLTFTSCPTLSTSLGCDAVPGDLGEMYKAVSAVDVDEGAKIGQAGHASVADFALNSSITRS